MMLRITLLWVGGMSLIVPVAIYQLLFHAQREDYALLIILPLFWVFGFWGVVGPVLAAWRVHAFAIENRVPWFVARWAVDAFLQKIQAADQAQGKQPRRA